MEKNNIQTNDAEVVPQKNNKAFKICFIVGCVFGLFAVIANVVCASIFLASSNSIADNAGDVGVLGGVLVGVIMIIAAIPCAIDSVISIVLTGLGIKWNKIAGIIVTAVISVTLLFLIVSFIVFLTAGGADTSATAQYLISFVGI